MKRLKWRTLDQPARVVLAARLLRAAPHTPAQAQAELAATLVGLADDLPARTLRELRESAPTALSLAGVPEAQHTPEALLRATSCLAQLLRNEFRVLDERRACVGAALFPAAARLNHGCAPNLAVSSAEAGKGWLLRLEAARDIAAGEELHFSYVDVGQPRSERARTLRQQYLFTCACGADTCAQDGSD